MIIKSKVRRDPENLGKANVSHVMKMGALRAPRVLLDGSTLSWFGRTVMVG